MANAITGGITLSVGLSQTLDAGATRLNSFVVPVNPSKTDTYAAGTTANSANKIYQASGSAAASPASIDLTGVTCVDGTTGLSHAREIIIYNDDTVDAHTLTLDGSASNAIAYFLAGTGPKVVIPGGSVLRLSKPLGTTGWVVDSTHKIVSLDPGANTVAYRVVVVGD